MAATQRGWLLPAMMGRCAFGTASGHSRIDHLFAGMHTYDLQDLHVSSSLHFMHCQLHLSCESCIANEPTIVQYISPIP